jgi:hypothetical protein
MYNVWNERTIYEGLIEFCYLIYGFIFRSEIFAPSVLLIKNNYTARNIS